MGDRVGVKHKLPRQQEKGESLGIKAFPPTILGILASAVERQNGLRRRAEPPQGGGVWLDAHPTPSYTSEQVQSPLLADLPQKNDYFSYLILYIGLGSNATKSPLR